MNTEELRPDISGPGARAKIRRARKLIGVDFLECAKVV